MYYVEVWYLDHDGIERSVCTGGFKTKGGASGFASAAVQGGVVVDDHHYGAHRVVYAKVSPCVD